MKPLTPDEAAAQAIQLFSQDARLCERHPNKIARKQGNIGSNKSETTNDVNYKSNLPTNEIESQSNYSNKDSAKYNCGKYTNNK